MIVSKIKDLLNDKDSVIAFDVDGVLALMEFGEKNHFLDDDHWDYTLKNDINTYTEDKVSKKVKDFIDKRNIDNIYVITKINHQNEYAQKVDYCNKYYNIKKENVFFVKSDDEKATVLSKIKEKYPDLEDEKIIMVDDTANVLTDIMSKTKFSTAHISSFLDI